MKFRRLRILVLAAALAPFAAVRVEAQSVNLVWDASAEADVSGYIVEWGVRPGVRTASVDVGNRTTWTVSGLDRDQRYYFSVRAYAGAGGARLYSPPSNETSNNALITYGPAGVVPDERPALFWQNTSTGQLMTWHLAGTMVTDTRPLSMAGPTDVNWRIIGSGDLNGDGYTDLVWKHETQGWLAVWYLRNEQVYGTEMLSISQMTDPAWRLAGVGDVNGDGYADLLWQHSDGWVATWMMRGSTVISTNFLSVPRVADPKWKVATAADINGDSYADLIWRHDDTGAIATWYLRGATVLMSGSFSQGAVTDLNWRIEAAGPVDNTGQPTLVWRHLTQGYVALWYLNGATVLRTTFLTPQQVDDPNWKIVGRR